MNKNQPGPVVEFVASYGALAASTVSIASSLTFVLLFEASPRRGFVANTAVESLADDAEQPQSKPAVILSETPTTEASDSEPEESVQESLPEPFCHESIVGESVEGRPIELIRVGDGEYVVLVLASIHGNESAGTPLVARLVDEVMAMPELVADKTLVVMPVVNPDGVHARSRYNARGIDLNRNFPADNRENSKRYGLEALSEPESLAIYQTIAEFLPRHIVTLHEPLQCVDYDGPASELAAAMSAVCPLPVKKLGSRPGSLGSYAGVTLQVPTITFELAKNATAQPPEFLWRFYGEALIEAVRFRYEPSARPATASVE